jgi:hypothetical protein
VADHGILILCAELHGTSYIRSNVRWAAPENFQVPEDDESISSPQLASDIYSFGCIMLQVCGQTLTPCNMIIILLAGLYRKSSVFRISKWPSSYRADTQRSEACSTSDSAHCGCSMGFHAEVLAW